MPDEVDIPTQPNAVASPVSLKLPNFWPSGPELWFAKAEALFAAQNITQEKFGHMVRVLPAQYTSEVRNIILRPPETPYTALKTNYKTASAHQNVSNYSSFCTWKTLVTITTLAAYVDASWKYSHSCCK